MKSQSNKRLNKLLSVFIVFAVVIFTSSGCGGSSGDKNTSDNVNENDGVDNNETTGVTGVTFYTDIASHRLMSFTPKEGVPGTIYGLKDENGLAQSVNGLSLKREDGEDFMSLDTQGRPAKVALSDGSQLTLDWESDTKLIATVVMSDGKTKASVPVDISAPQKSVRKIPPKSGRSEIVNATVDISVTLDDEPVPDAYVIQKVSWGGDTTPIHYHGYTDSAGNVSFGWVNLKSLIPPDAVENSCNTILEIYGDACDGISVVAPAMLSGGCLMLGAAISTVGTPALGAALTLSCEAAFAGAESMCVVAEAMPEGASGGLCAAIEATVSEFSPDGSVVTVTARKDGLTNSVSREVPSSQTDVKFDIALDLPPCDFPEDDSGNSGSYTYSGSSSGSGASEDIQYGEGDPLFNIYIGDDQTFIDFNFEAHSTGLDIGTYNLVTGSADSMTLGAMLATGDAHSWGPTITSGTLSISRMEPICAFTVDSVKLQLSRLTGAFNGTADGFVYGYTKSGPLHYTFAGNFDGVFYHPRKKPITQ